MKINYANAFDLYVKGEISLSQLREYSESISVPLFKGEEVERFLNNKFLVEMKAEEVGVPSKQVKQKLRELIIS